MMLSQENLFAKLFLKLLKYAEIGLNFEYIFEVLNKLSLIILIEKHEPIFY
jgi:hypothetical protein